MAGPVRSHITHLCSLQYSVGLRHVLLMRRRRRSVETFRVWISEAWSADVRAVFYCLFDALVQRQRLERDRECDTKHRVSMASACCESERCGRRLVPRFQQGVTVTREMHRRKHRGAPVSITSVPLVKPVTGHREQSRRVMMSPARRPPTDQGPMQQTTACGMGLDGPQHDAKARKLATKQRKARKAPTDHSSTIFGVSGPAYLSFCLKQQGKQSK
jgi:hypothetical protein